MAKLKLKLKSGKPKNPKTYTLKDFPDKTIVREEDQPRRVKTYHVLWIEVFASFNADEVDLAHRALQKIPASAYALLDKEVGDKMIMTSDAFYAEARRAVHDAGLKPWGVD